MFWGKLFKVKNCYFCLIQMLPPKERQLPSECTLLRKEFFGLREKIPTMYVGIFVTFGILLKDNLRIQQNFVYKAQIVFLFFFFFKAEPKYLSNNSFIFSIQVNLRYFYDGILNNLLSNQKYIHSCWNFLHDVNCLNSVVYVMKFKTENLLPRKLKLKSFKNIVD